MSTTQRIRIVYDRGPRPIGRGWYHFIAAIASVVSGTVLATYAWLTHNTVESISVTIYALGIVALFGVSAAYHLIPWATAKQIAGWRLADHSTIGIFIAATYTPLCVIALSGWQRPLLLSIAWTGAAAIVLLNALRPQHPRWIDVALYVALGWVVVPLIPALWNSVGPAVVWLLFAGGIVYTMGALVYAFRWPGRSARWLGYHEHFHAATIVAAVVHLVAMWFVLC